MNNQMPMGGGFPPNPYMQQNMNQANMNNMGNMNNMMGQQPIGANDSVNEKDKKKSTKFIKLGILLVIVLVVVFGARYIKYITVDYESIIDSSLTKYYVSDNTQDLNEIKDLLETYKKNPKMIQNIQSYTYSKVGDWLSFTYDKFVCDSRNFNTCLAKLDAFNKLLKKIDSMYTVKGGGYFVISTNGYQELKTKGNKVVDELTAVSRNRGSYSSPQNSETIHSNRCKVAKDCSNCNNNTGVCVCKYDTKDENGNNTLGDVVCYKPEMLKRN